MNGLLKFYRRWQIPLDFLLIFIFTAALIRPLFKAAYFDKWASIEGSYIADARFLADHWPHPRWQPLWYAGVRYDYIASPAVRYGTALISKAAGAAPVKAYHFYVAFFYCVGIAGVYLFVRIATRSRGMAWLCAAATALLSPSFLFLTPMRQDAWMLLPNRLGVLVKYGDGPHMTALALIPFALVFSWLALDRRRPAPIALAALFAAAVVSTDLYSAGALGIFYFVLVWSFWITRQDKRIVAPAVAIPALACGLIAFWLLPSYFVVTAENLRYLTEHGTTWSIWIGLASAIVFALASDRFARGKKDGAWAVFVVGIALFFSLNVLGNYYFGFRIYGEPKRMAPELDLACVLLIATAVRWLWNRPGPLSHVVAVLVVVGGFATSLGYLRHAWHMFPTWPDYRNRIEYRISDWLFKNMPDARIAASGSVRLWLDAWRDLPQLDGSDPALLNALLQRAHWEITLDPKPEASILWMQCLGVDAVYVPDSKSEERYKEIAYPQKFDGALAVLFDDQKGNRIYRVPRRFPSRARVVDTRRMNALQAPRFNNDIENLKAYADAIEKGPDLEVTLTRQGTDTIDVRTKLEAGQSILVQESYDSGWRAWSAGRQLSIRKDVMGFMIVDAPPGNQALTLAFVTPLEKQVGRVLAALAVLALISLIAIGIRRKSA